MKIKVNEALGSRFSAALEYNFNGEFLAYVYAERDYEDYLPKHYDVVVVNAEGKEIRRDRYYTMLTAALEQSIATAMTQVKNLTRWVEEFAQGYTDLLSKYKLKGTLVVSPAGLLEGYMWSDIKNLTHDVHLTFGLTHRMSGMAKRAVGVDGIRDSSCVVGIQVQDEPSEAIPCAGVSTMLGVIEEKFKEWTQE